ncbi:hypothetical protein [Rhodoluna sp.]|uniref:hypothetical protein n=1 Tax=Rhodoluna sp. TaxID=1969481 RepID=UPI0025E23111|nr:hypothetical protein [Rhodoluna sp.]
MKSKFVAFIAIVASLAIVPSNAAQAATPVAGTESYRYVATLSTGSASMNDTGTLKFDNVTAEFNYDISAVPVGTHIEFSLSATGTKSLTVDKGCCVIGGIDGTREMLGVSYGGGVWEHTKIAGEQIANLRIINTYNEFLDSKYKGLLGRLTAATTVKIGDQEPVAVTSENSTNYKISFGFKTYGKSFVVPAHLTKLWLETQWSPKGAIAKGTVLTFTDPKIQIFNATTKKSTNFAFKNHGFGLSLTAYNNTTNYFQERVGNKLTVTQAGATVYMDQGIYLPTNLPVGSKITTGTFKITK